MGFPASPAVNDTYPAVTPLWRWDGTSWNKIPYGGVGGIADGNKGDVTVSGSGGTFAINNAAVSNAKMANMVTSRIKGRKNAVTGAPEDLTAGEVSTIIGAPTLVAPTGGLPISGAAPASGVIEWTLTGARPAARLRALGIKASAGSVLWEFSRDNGSTWSSIATAYNGSNANGDSYAGAGVELWSGANSYLLNYFQATPAGFVTTTEAHAHVGTETGTCKVRLRCTNGAGTVLEYLHIAVHQL